MSGEKSDERALSLEDLFLSGDFGRVHQAQPVAGPPAEPQFEARLPRAPRSPATPVGHVTTTHRLGSTVPHLPVLPEVPALPPPFGPR